jgi:hypothetical protein
MGPAMPTLAWLTSWREGRSIPASKLGFFIGIIIMFPLCHPVIWYRALGARQADSLEGGPFKLAVLKGVFINC